MVLVRRLLRIPSARNLDNFINMKSCFRRNNVRGRINLLLLNGLAVIPKYTDIIKSHSRRDPDLGFSRRSGPDPGQIHPDPQPRQCHRNSPRQNEFILIHSICNSGGLNHPMLRNVRVLFTIKSQGYREFYEEQRA